MKIGDICPECGEAAVVNEEGCPSNVRPSAMLAGSVSVRMKETSEVFKTSEVWCYGVTK